MLGKDAGTCQNFAADQTAGRCLWGTLGLAKSSVQLTAFSGNDFETKKARWKVAFPAVQGVGQGAWSRGPITQGAATSVVLYVDYGSFGMEFAVGAPSATTDMAVKLAQAIK